MSSQSSLKPTVLLTGATGFIGSAIRSALNANHQPTRLLARSRTQQAGDQSSVVLGDVTDPRSVAAALDNVSIIVHAASYVGPDPQEQRRINIEGTRLLVTTAANRGVDRLIYVSTFGVYGSRYRAGIAEGDEKPHPRSTLSKSRYEAEQIVLANGGTVVRPALIIGHRERWVVPALVRLIAALGTWIDDGRQLISVLHCDELGHLVARLSQVDSTAEILHAARPQPTTIRDLAIPVLERLGWDPPTTSISVQDGLRKLRAMHIDDSKARLATTDSWIDANRIWVATGLRRPGSGSVLTPDDVDGYATLLSGPS